MSKFTVIGQHLGGTGEGMVTAVMLTDAKNKNQAFNRFIAATNSIPYEDDIEVIEGFQIDNPYVEHMVPARVIQTIKEGEVHIEFFAEFYINA
jgi:hypothetical protein